MARNPVDANPRQVFQGLQTRQSTSRQAAIKSHMPLPHIRPHGFFYAQCPGRALRVAMYNLPRELSAFSFVDYGSGEGGILLEALLYPFADIVGVEFAKELHQTAEHNIASAKANSEPTRSIRTLHLDAAEFSVPRTECVHFFYHPFGETVFREVLRNIEEAHIASGRRKAFILYVHVSDQLEVGQADNLALLRNAEFLRERRVHCPSWWDRFLLGSYELRLFESLDPPAS